MAEENAVHPESTRSQLDDVLRGFSTDELRQLLAEIEQVATVEVTPRRSGLRLVGGTYINESIARANIDRYLDALKRPDVPTDMRSMPNERLLEEQSRRDRRSEQLAFAESKAAACRAWADRQRSLTESFAPGSVDRELGEALLANFEALAQSIDGFCRRMRLTANQ